MTVDTLLEALIFEEVVGWFLNACTLLWVVAYYSFAHKCDASTTIARTSKVESTLTLFGIVNTPSEGVWTNWPSTWKETILLTLVCYKCTRQEKIISGYHLYFLEKRCLAIDWFCNSNCWRGSVFRCLVLGKVKGSGNCVASFLFLCSPSTRQVNNRQTSQQ